MSIVVYGLLVSGKPVAHEFEQNQLKNALDCCENMRNNGFTHVVMSCNYDGQVGKDGVDSVKDGKLPDGTDYDWRKRR